MVSSTKFYGKYRGKVINNVDPLNIGRLQVEVSDIASHIGLKWALPCVPPGPYLLPAVGANVWVEFEQGNLDYPVWVGCFLCTRNKDGCLYQSPEGGH